MRSSPHEMAVVLRNDFCSSVQRCFYELNPQAPFHINWHVELIAAKLEAVRRGTIKRLIINVPPRHLKSLCASIAFPAGCLGHAPSAQLLYVSCARSLRQAVPRLPERDDEPLVRAGVPNPALVQAALGSGADHDGLGLAPSDLDQRRADRTRSGHHRHRRSAQARRGPVRNPAARGQRMVRLHPLHAAERQAAGAIMIIMQRLHPDLKRAVQRQAERFTPSVILIEDKASGTQLIQELHEEGVYAVLGYCCCPLESVCWGRAPRGGVGVPVLGRVRGIRLPRLGA